jgi:hypothetical protein
MLSKVCTFVMFYKTLHASFVSFCRYMSRSVRFLSILLLCSTLTLLGDSGGPILEWKGKWWEQVGSRCESNLSEERIYYRLESLVTKTIVELITSRPSIQD